MTKQTNKTIRLEEVNSKHELKQKQEEQVDTSTDLQKEGGDISNVEQANKENDKVAQINPKAPKNPELGSPVFIEPYIKAYPKEKLFYVASDNQVFLEKDYSLAVLHQASLKNEQKLQTIIIQ